MFVSGIIVWVVLIEDNLHEPMYILICNLVLNGIFGSTTFFPKIIIDLFSLSKTISRAGCSIQTLCILTFSLYEIASFTIMAYDRYVSVCHPLHYVIMVTNEKALNLILGSFAFCFLSSLIAVILTATLPLCGSSIKNVYCDNMALVNMSCVDSTVNNLYGLIVTLTFLIITLSSIAYSYVRIFVVCLKVSKDACQKAIHTLVTHILNFSIFMVGALFVFVRFRLSRVNAPIIMHIMFSITYLVIPPLFNPVIYGIRTKALRIKVIHHLQKINIWKHLCNYKELSENISVISGE
ncbi:olfactory receptor 52B6-like [Discoglossus pictus]